MINIRKIRPEDAPKVRDMILGIMENEFHGEVKRFTMHDMEQPDKYYGGKNDIFLVAEENGEIIGTVAVKEDARDTALLRRVFVRKDCRGKGCGARLMNSALDFCFQHNYQNVVFRGVDKMQAALKLCLKNGFEKTNFPLQGDVNLTVLTRTLNDGGAVRPES